MTSGKRAVPGRHAGPPRLEEPTVIPGTARPSQFPLMLLSLGITAAVVAWGYLVYLAIDFGTSARDGETQAWGYLALATIGAIACLFFGLMLGARLVTRLRRGSGPTAPVPPPGGRRAAR